MTTEPTRRLKSFLPTNPNAMPTDEASGSDISASRAPLPPRLAARRPTAWEAERAAAAEAAKEHSSAAAGQGPYFGFARRWWWLLILGALLGGVAAFGYTRYGTVPF